MKNLLKLLISGGIAVAIASSIAIGIVVNKNKSTSTESTEPVVTNEITSNHKTSNEAIADEVDPEIPGLSRGFKSNFLDKTKYNLARQAILGIPMDKNKNWFNDETIKVKANEKELEILDLSKTIGNLEWILKQVKYPDEDTSSISLKTLGTVEYEQTTKFAILREKHTQSKTGSGYVFWVKVNLEYVTKTKNWDFIFTLKVGIDWFPSIKGVMAEKMVVIPKSKIFKKALNTAALYSAGLQILLWKKGSTATTDASDADLAIILNKRTGKVFIWAKNKMQIVEQTVTAIEELTIEGDLYEP